MLCRKDVPELSEASIRDLSGGRKHNHCYFIGILENRNSDCIISVLRAKLQSQMGSQTSPSYPQGYEPFSTPYGTQRFYLDRFDFPVPILAIAPWAVRPVVRLVRKAACILDFPQCGDATHEALMQEDRRFRWMRMIRERSASDDLHVSLSLLDPSSRKDCGNSRSLEDLCTHFERLLSWAPSDALRDLAALLAMPNTGPGGPL